MFRYVIQNPEGFRGVQLGEAIEFESSDAVNDAIAEGAVLVLERPRPSEIERDLKTARELAQLEEEVARELKGEETPHADLSGLDSDPGPDSQPETLED